MMEHPEILVRLEYISKATDDIRAHLRELNTKTARNVSDIAVLQSQMQDVRQQDIDARKSGGRWGAGAGAFVGGIIVAVYQMFGGAR